MVTVCSLYLACHCGQAIVPQILGLADIPLLYLNDILVLIADLNARRYPTVLYNSELQTALIH